MPNASIELQLASLPSGMALESEVEEVFEPRKNRFSSVVNAPYEETRASLSIVGIRACIKCQLP